jgi:hypothetical protein
MRVTGHSACVGLFIVVLTLTGCFLFRSVKVESLSTAGPVTVTSTVKAHLTDGSTILFPEGITVTADSVRGFGGTRWNLTLTDSGPVTSVPLDSVIALESFRTSVNWGKSIGISTLTTLGITGAVVAIACAADPKCFGSCPTFYSDSAGVHVLEAEGFSYAIAPVFESRDVDRLRAGANSTGDVRVEVRNEALETHYLNYLSLLEVRHAPDEMALTDRLRQPIAVRGLTALPTVVERGGRDVTEVVASHDGHVFRTDSALLASVSLGDHDDHLITHVPVPVGADSVALVFRMRNSLLTTVLLYDLMLGDRGARALDWLAEDLAKLGTAVALGSWAVEELGLRVEVPDGDGWRVVGRFGDAGPVAWKDVAIIVPVTEAPRQPVRVSFLADNWRIDRIAFAEEWRRLKPRAIPLTEAIDPEGRSVPEIVQLLSQPDTDYLRTSMGQRFESRFATGPPPDIEARTFFLVSQGYYTEWIRRAWLRQGHKRAAFVPEPAALLDALRRWRATQDSTERAFYATRVPLR